MSPQLLAVGHGYEKVKERHLKLAPALVELGVQWRIATTVDKPHVEQLVRDHIHGVSPSWVIDKDSGAIAAVDDTGQIITALVVAAAGLDEHVLATIRYVAVDPAWRRRGVGTVTLGVLPQLVQRATGRVPDFTIGNCAPEHARYYQRAGFTVLQPGERLVLPFGTPAAVALSNQHYPCWFSRAF